MSDIPADLLYTKEHEWVMIEDGIATMGITDHAQNELGDITFVELPEDEMDIAKGNELANIESVKAASPVYAPVSGSVTEINSELEEEPGAINSDPFDGGWICRISMSDESETAALMTPEKYEEFLLVDSDDE